MAGGGERGAVADFKQDAGCGPDTDAGHRGQDPGKRVRIKHPLDLAGDLITLVQQVTQAVSQSRQDGLGRGRAGHDYGLRVQRGQDLFDQAGAHARGSGLDDFEELRPARLADPGRTTASRQQLQHCRMLQFRAQDPFQRWVDLGEQATDPVGDAGDLAGEVVVVADQNFQFGEGLVAGVDPAQRVRKGPGGIRDHVRVPGVGLGCARMQISQAAHDQTRQVGHLMPTRPGDGYGQRADRGGLVDHDQDPTVPAELVEQPAQPRLGVRQCGVVQPLTLRVQRDRVVTLLADVQPYEDAEPVVHAWPPHHRRDHSAAGPSAGLPASTLRRDLPEQGWPGPYQRSADATRPGDNTPPPDHAYDRGRESYRAGRPRSPRLGTIKKVTGGATTRIAA